MSESSVEIPDSLSAAQMRLMMLFYVVLALTIGYLIAELWPASPAARASFFLFTRRVGSLPAEVRLILLSMAAGALGSYVHGATSFVTFMGNRTLTRSWISWYLLRPFIGSALALLFYFVLRGGFLSPTAGAAAVSPFGIAALSALAGMFSKQATDKLREVFDTMFKTTGSKGDEQRKDKLDVTAHPSIHDLVPVEVKVNKPVPLLVNGSGFSKASVVRVQGVERATSFIKASQLSIALTDNDVSAAGELRVDVQSPGPGGTSSNAIALPVVPGE